MILRWNRIQISWIVGLSLVFAVFIAVGLSAPALAQEQPPASKATDGCPNPKFATNINGTGDQNETKRFRVTGDKIRIRYFKDQDSSIFFDLFSDNSESAGVASTITAPSTGSRIIDVTGDPGNYFFALDVAPENTEYKLAIDNCNGNVNDDNSNNDSGRDQYASNDRNVQEDVEVTNIINIPAKNLPDTGGPPLLAIGFSLIVGAGLLTAVVRRRR